MFDLIILGLVVLECIIVACIVVDVRQRKPYSCFFRLLLPLLAIASAIAIVTMLLPVSTEGPESRRRMVCANHLKQIALALHDYHDTWDCWPPAVTYDETGRAMHSWRVLVLPFLEQQALYEAYDLNEPWSGPNNSALLSRMPDVFRCPSVTARGKRAGQTSYCTNYLAVTSALQTDKPRKLSTAWPDKTPLGVRDLIDGSSNIILVAESFTDPVVWTEPRDLHYETLPLAINDGTGVGLSSYHPGGCQVALADGTVRFLPDTIPADTLRKLLLCNDGEPVEDY